MTVDQHARMDAYPSPKACIIALVMLPLLFVVRSDANPECGLLRFVGNWPFGPSLSIVLDEARNLAFMSGGGAV